MGKWNSWRKIFKVLCCCSKQNIGQGQIPTPTTAQHFLLGLSNEWKADDSMDTVVKSFQKNMKKCSQRGKRRIVPQKITTQYYTLRILGLDFLKTLCLY